jgi:hypothetical protein
MPCHNGGKLEHAGQRGHLIPAAKPSQANEEEDERSNSGSSYLCAGTLSELNLKLHNQGNQGNRLPVIMIKKAGFLFV